NGFFIAQHGTNYRMNNRENKLAYWTGGADAGSTFLLTEREFTVVEPEVPAQPTLNETVVFDFANNSWGIPTMEENNYTAIKSAGEYTDGVNTIKIDPTANKGSYIYDKNGFLNIGKPGSKIVLPAFGFAVEKIEVVGHSSASSYPNVDMNVYVGETAVSTACVGSTETYTYEIAADNQAAGNVYELVIGSNGGNYSSTMYITYIKVYPRDNKLEAPVISLESGVYVGEQTVTVASPTAEIEGVTNVTYYYTTDGNEPSVEDEETDGEITISENCTLKVVVELTYGEKTYLSASTSAEYIISESADFNKATAFYPGEYIMVANGYIAAPAKDNFLPAAETTVNGNAVSAAVYYTLTFESAEGGYYIKNTKGEYISTSETAMKDKTDIYHNQYPSGSWYVTIKEDGTADITSNGQTLVFDAASSTFVTYLTDKVPADAVYPALYSAPLRMTGIKPADGAVVESLKEIRVMFNNSVVLDESKEITLTDSEGTSANIGSSVNGTELVISVNEDLYNGDYTLTIAENAVSDMNGNSYGEAITATYELKYALDTFVPVSITPADGETVETLKTIVLDYTPDFPGRIIDETVINVTDENGNQVATGKLGFSSASYYAVEIVLNEEIATAGTYTVTIPMGCIWNGKWQGVSGRYNPEIVLTYTVTGSTFEVVNVTPDPEAEHASIKTIHVEFSDNIYTDVLTQDDAFGIYGPNGKTYYASWSILEKVLIITLYEEATAPGVYTLDIPGNAFKRLKDSRPFEGARYTFTVSVPEGIEGIGAENETKTIYDLTGRKIEKITEGGIYIVNGKKVYVK
ncbi:MAG: Ig-like domain-containing protein, partial [Bacteroidaceae bacterium]|nr:Ig-like domain-containing protein [Bacteroidaceae bacterium]